MVSDASQIGSALSDYLTPLGLESHPFLVGLYNERVGEKFKLDYPPSTLAFVVLSQPSMFEKTFVPFLLGNNRKFDLSSRDPLDECMRETMSKVNLPGHYKLNIMHDFELQPNRRPKVLVQTAAHVSGSVRFFQESDVKDKSKLREEVEGPKVYPVCLHPRFGGWFAIRAVVVFENVTVETLEIPTPRIDLSDDKIIELLKLYNNQWRDWSFRDVISPEERYSSLQQEYFSTEPAKRGEIVRRLEQNKP